MKLSMGEIPFSFLPKGLFFFFFHFCSPAPTQCWWIAGNDASYWERSSFPGATIFSETAFILNWLVTVFLACLIWHDYSLKQPAEEPRAAPALAAGAVARICSPEAAAKQGATTQPLEGFPIAVTACCLQNDFAHLALGFVALCIFIPAGGIAALIINNVVGRNYISDLSGVQRQLWVSLRFCVARFPLDLAQWSNKPLYLLKKKTAKNIRNGLKP